jgi:DNA repair protein RadD
MIPTLRDYQETVIKDIRNAFVIGKKSVCLVLPTGAGKTLCFAYIAWTASMRGKKILILVHRKELLRQTAQKLRDFGVEPGMISPQYRPNYNASIQVAMVQTMVGRGHLYRHFDLVITDECHHVAASTYLKSISRYPNAYQLGVTATPIRTDGKGLGINTGGIYEHMVVGPQTADLIRAGYLVEPVIHVPPSLVDLTGVRKLGGEYNIKQATERVDKKSITGDAMEHYLSSAKYEPAVVFCASVKHAEHVAAEWRQAGIRAVSVDGSQRGRDVGRDGSDLVDRALRGLADGSVHAVMSCDLISEGTDIPAISYMADLGPLRPPWGATSKR